MPAEGLGAPRAAADRGELRHGIPLFLDHLIATLGRRISHEKHDSTAATQHGGDLLKHGFTIAQVVHDFGDVCQAVTDLAIERRAPISTEEFKALNLCLDEAIADAVTEFSRVRDLGRASEGNERLGMLAHEVRNLLTSATFAFDVLKSGSVGVAGSTGAVLERLLSRLGLLVDQSLAEVRLEAGSIRRQRIDLRQFLEELEIVASLSAKKRGVSVSVAVATEDGLAIEGDPQILSAIVVNLVQNAVKFSRAHGHVAVTTRATADRIQIDVADECGGLPPGTAAVLFKPFEQRNADRIGLGLGLVIARRGAEAHGGAIHVRDIPGTGCIFTLELPRKA